MRYLIAFLLLMMAMPLVLAADFYVTQSQQYNVTSSCSINGGPCDSSSTCNITIFYPYSSTLINNQAMTNTNDGNFNYTLNSNQTSIRGEYSGKIYCRSGNTNQTTLFNYGVNPSGIEPSQSRTQAVSRSVYVMLFIASLFFLAFLFIKESYPLKLTMMIISFIFVLISVNVIFVGMQEEVVNPKLENLFDGIAAITFILYWFAGGTLALLWFFTFINTYFYKKNEQNFKKFGGGNGQ